MRVLLAEDEAEVRAALSEVVELEPGLELVGAASDAAEAIELGRTHRPDVALLDVKMPAGGGTHAARGIAEVSPATRVLALSAYEDRESVMQMLQAGAVGYLVKGAPVEDIVGAIRGAAEGRGTLSREVTTGVIRELADHLERDALVEQQRRRLVEQVRGVIEHGRLRIVFQPIFHLAQHRMAGLEALSRFPSDFRSGPAVAFAEAEVVGLRAELELAAVTRALRQLDELPRDAYLSLNLSPDTARSPACVDLLRRQPVERLVLELTEHAPVEDYDGLTEALAELRERGIRLAVDDAGAGFASLRHILKLKPDIIKLDISLTRDVDTDQARRALATGLISFAGEIGSAVVAEGIETRAELETLQRLGVEYAQGYFLARPGPPPASPPNDALPHGDGNCLVLGVRP